MNNESNEKLVDILSKKVPNIDKEKIRESHKVHKYGDPPLDKMKREIKKIRGGITVTLLGEPSLGKSEFGFYCPQEVFDYVFGVDDPDEQDKRMCEIRTRELEGSSNRRRILRHGYNIWQD